MKPHWELQRYQAGRAISNLPEALKTCEHSGGMRNLYVARMFRVFETSDGLDKLYSSFVEIKCSNCSLVPSEPGLCLVCSKFLFVGSSCCQKPCLIDGSAMGECTRHATACGEGNVNVLTLLHR